MPRWLLLALLVGIYLPGLGSPEAGTHPDEAYYLGISAEMDVKGAWLTPTIEDRPAWYKPPLLYWAERACYAVLGRTVLAGRLPSALAAIGLAFAVLALARRLCGPERAELAALLTATTFGFFKFGRLAMMDAPMALALTLAALGAWRASEEDEPGALWLVGLGAGVTSLLKGPVGAMLVLLIAGGFLALRKPRLLATRHTALAFALGAAIALPWYVASFVVHGQAFWDFFVIGQNMDRFRHPWTLGGEATLLLGFLAFMMPWTPLFLASCGKLRTQWREPAVLLPLVWIAAVLLVFTIPALKWPHYGLACTPAAMILAARVGSARWLTAAAATAGLTLSLVLGVAVPLLNPPLFPDSLRTAVADRPLYCWEIIPGLYTLAAGRPVHRVWHDGEWNAALDKGGAVLLLEDELAKLSPQVRSRFADEPIARWPRITRHLTYEAARRALGGEGLAAITEQMIAVVPR